MCIIQIAQHVSLVYMDELIVAPRYPRGFKERRITMHECTQFHVDCPLKKNRINGSMKPETSDYWLWLVTTQLCRPDGLWIGRVHAFKII